MKAQAGVVDLKLRLLSIFFLFFLFENGAFGQQLGLQAKVTLHVQHESLASVFDSLSAKTGFLFSYDPTVVPVNKRVTINFEQHTLKECLTLLLAHDSLSFQFSNRHVIISKQVAKRRTVFQCKGKIIDAISGQPLEFATISFRGKTVGTVSNAKGDFVLNIPVALSDERLWISYVGYEPESYSIKSDTLLKVKLMAAPDMMKDVVIEYVDPKDLIHAVFDKIENNYTTKPVNMTGFYREISKKNSDYVSITEAVVAIEKSSYTSGRRDKIRLVKGRKSTDVVRMDTLAYKFQGGLSTCLFLDAIKNCPSFVDREYERFYNYKLEKIQTIENENVYAISFEQKPQTEYPFYCGKLYINSTTKALEALEFSLSPSGFKYASQALVVKSPLKYRVKPVIASYTVSYRIYNGKWYLNHVRSETVVNVRRRNKLFSQTYSTVAEMVITQFDTIPTPASTEGILIKPNDIISDKSLPYDPKFWGDENVIKPEEPIENALKRLSNQLAAWKKGIEEFDSKLINNN